MTPEIDAAELYYDGPTGFVPIEDARKVERKLNDALESGGITFLLAEKHALENELEAMTCKAAGWQNQAELNARLLVECREKAERYRLEANAMMAKLHELQAYADKLADGLPEGMLPKDVENLRNANAGLAEDLRKAKLERGEALAALQQTCATNTEIRRELEEARREIAKLKASSNENYWELSRQRGNMLHALHEISAAVKRGMRQGGITIGETEVLGRMEGRE